MKKSIVSLFLALAMMVNVFPVAAFAADGGEQNSGLVANDSGAVPSGSSEESGAASDDKSKEDNNGPKYELQHYLDACKRFMLAEHQYYVLEQPTAEDEERFEEIEDEFFELMQPIYNGAEEYGDLDENQRKDEEITSQLLPFVKIYEAVEQLRDGAYDCECEDARCADGAVNARCLTCVIDGIENCEYIAPVDEAVEAVRTLVSALPAVEEVMTLPMEQQGEIYNETQAAYEAYLALDEEQQAQLAAENEKLTALLMYFASPQMVAPAASTIYNVKIGNGAEYLYSGEAPSVAGDVAWYVNGTGGTDGTVHDTEPPNWNARLSYDGSSFILTLNGLELTDTEAVNGIYAPTGDLKLVLNGTNTVTSDTSGTSANTAGIYVGGDLIVSGSGTLNVTGGDADQSSCGIRLIGAGSSFTLESGTLTAQGGSAGGGSSSLGIKCAGTPDIAEGFTIKAGDSEAAASTVEASALGNYKYVRITPPSTHGHPFCGYSADCPDSANHASHAVTGGWLPLTYDETSGQFMAGNEKIVVDLYDYGAVELPAGNYYLDGDITFDGEKFASFNVVGATKLCLNGKTITGSGSDSAIIVESNATLTLCDCIGGGKVDGKAKRALSVSNTHKDVTVNLYGGTLTSSANDTVYFRPNKSVLNMYGGTVENTGTNCALYISDTNNGNSFNLYGGNITAEGDYAVYVETKKLYLRGTPVIESALADFNIQQGSTNSADNYPIHLGEGFGKPDAPYTFDYERSIFSFDNGFAVTDGFGAYESEYSANEFFKCVEKGYFMKVVDSEIRLFKLAITKQPTEDNNYTVTLNSTDGASYQWCSYGAAELVTTANASAAGGASFNAADGTWSAGPEVQYNTTTCFTISLNKDDRLTVSTATSGSFLLCVGDIANYVDETSDEVGSFIAPDTAVYTVYFMSDGGGAPQPITAQVSRFSELTGQTANALNTEGLASGTYLCNVKYTDGTLLQSASVEYVAPAIEGTVTVSGETTPGGTLTAAVSNSNSTGTLSYKWQRVDNSTSPATVTDIDGATGASYTLTDSDVGFVIRCVVTGSANVGSIFGDTAAPVVPALTGTVAISGESTPGGTLTAAVSGSNSTGTFSYKWQRVDNTGNASDTDIPGANDASYTLADDDAGHIIRCVVTDSVNSGSIFGDTAKAVGPVAPTTPTALSESVSGAKDGKIIGVDDTMEYSTDGGNTWTAVPNDTTEINFLEPGSVLVRVKETDNAGPGKPIELTVAVGPSIVVTFDGNAPISLTANTPAAPIGLVYGSKLTQPADPTLSDSDDTDYISPDDYEFGGWYKDNTCTAPWDFSNDTLTGDTTIYAKWIKVNFTIDVTIEDEDHNGINDVAVKLMQGSEVKDEGGVTKNGGIYVFASHVPAGIYNIVASRGDQTKTMFFEVTASDIQATITMIEGANSVLQSGSGLAENVVVGGLDTYVENEKANSSDSYTATMKIVEAPSNTPGVSNIKSKAQSDGLGKVHYLDATILLKKNNETPQEIKEPGEVMKMVIPFDFSNVKDGTVKVYRYHVNEDGSNNGVEEFTSGADADKTFLVDKPNGVIHLFGKYFSVYAIGYEEIQSTGTGNTDANGGGSPYDDDDSDDNNSTYRDYEEEFWKQVQEKIESTRSGYKVIARAGGYDRMPAYVMKSLLERTDVTLEIHWNGGDVITIPAGKAPDEQNRIYYPLSYLESYDFGSIDWTKFNPETGGSLEIAAPAISNSIVTPDGKPEITDPRRETAATIEDAVNGIEKTIPGVFEPKIENVADQAAKNSGINGTWILLAMLAVGSGWIIRKKQKEKAAE